jgi:hypothetical protein
VIAVPDGTEFAVTAPASRPRYCNGNFPDERKIAGVRKDVQVQPAFFIPCRAQEKKLEQKGVALHFISGTFRNVLSPAFIF